MSYPFTGIVALAAITFLITMMVARLYWLDHQDDPE